MEERSAENAASERAVERTPADVIRRVLEDRGVTAEQVLAAIFDTLAEDYLCVLPEDVRIEGLAGSDVLVPPQMAALCFRRLMQRMCAINFEEGRREDDPTTGDDDWMLAKWFNLQATAQAAAVEMFDGVSVVAAATVEQEKAEAELMGRPDPYPHLEFVEGSRTQMTITPPDPPSALTDSPTALPASKAPGKARDGTIWN